MFNDGIKTESSRDKQIIMKTVLFLIFIVAPLILSGCRVDSCVNSDNNTINLSVIGEAYFPVRAPEEEKIYFAKSSSFSLNQENKLVTPQCYLLQGWALDDEGYMMGARKDIWLQEQILIENISSDGVILVKLVDGTILPAFIIGLAMFEHPENLNDEGNGLYSETAKSGQPCTTKSGGHCFDEFTASGTIDFETF